jgi:hypothetical protein
MEQQNYHISISAKTAVENAVAAINNVAAWWGNDVDGTAQNLHDHFTIHFGETWGEFEVTEIDPGKKTVWLVLDCNLHWLRDTKEWKGYTLVWEMSAQNEQVTINFTQVGLVPAVECYADCEKGWNFYVGESLLQLIKTGEGKPDTSKGKRVVS